LTEKSIVYSRNTKKPKSEVKNTEEDKEGEERMGERRRQRGGKREKKKKFGCYSLSPIYCYSSMHNC
jgi:hypothetical protein